MTEEQLVDAFLNSYGVDNEAALHYAYDLIMMLENAGVFNDHNGGD